MLIECPITKFSYRLPSPLIDTKVSTPHPFLQVTLPTCPTQEDFDNFPTLILANLIARNIKLIIPKKGFLPIGGELSYFTVRALYAFTVFFEHATEATREDYPQIKIAKDFENLESALETFAKIKTGAKRPNFSNADMMLRYARKHTAQGTKPFLPETARVILTHAKVPEELIAFYLPILTLPKKLLEIHPDFIEQDVLDVRDYLILWDLNHPIRRVTIDYVERLIDDLAVLPDLSTFTLLEPAPQALTTENASYEELLKQATRLRNELKVER